PRGGGGGGGAAGPAPGGGGGRGRAGGGRRPGGPGGPGVAPGRGDVLGRHDHRKVGVGRRDVRQDRRVHHGQAGHAVHAGVRADDRPRSRVQAHRAGTDRVVVGPRGRPDPGGGQAVVRDRPAGRAEPR